MFTQFNLESPTNAAVCNWFTATKVDNSASTDASMPPAKSPNFTYNAEVVGDAGVITEVLQIWYDKTDGYKKKLNYMGTTTNLLTQGASDAEIDISLEGEINPITFLVACKDKSKPGYIYNPVDSSIIVLDNSGSAATQDLVIADLTNFSDIYNNMNQLPQGRNLSILAESPNPLLPDGSFVSAFTFNKNFVENNLLFTFTRQDNSIFSVTHDLLDAANIEVVNGVTLDNFIETVDSGTTTNYLCANIAIIPIQRSGYSQNADGTYTETTPEPIANGTKFNPDFDGFRILLKTDLDESIEVGGDTLTKLRIDNGVYRKSSGSARRMDLKEVNRVRSSKIIASPVFRNNFKKLAQKINVKK